MALNTGHLKTITLVLVISVAAAANAGDLYRWVNPQGNTVVSDRPPAAGIEYDVISAKTGRTVEEPAQPGPAIAAPAKPATAKAPEQNREISQFSAPEKNPELCEQARRNLEILETGPRIRFTDDSGEVRFMGDDEREVEKDKTRDAISAYCK